MTIDIHEKIGKLPIIPKKDFVLPNMRFCGLFNPIEKKLIYDQNGNILRYIQKPTGKQMRYVVNMTLIILLQKI